MSMKVKLYWVLASAVYFYASFYVLWSFAGAEADGSGCMPRLTLPGLMPPNVSIREYLENGYVRFQYRVPHFVFALVFTVLGGIVPSRLLRRYAKLRKRPFATFAAAMAIGFVLLLVGPAALDIGNRLKLLPSQTWFAWDVSMVYLMVRVFAPLVLLSGLVTLGARWFEMD